MTTTSESEKGRVLDGLVRPFGIAAAGLLTAFAGQIAGKAVIVVEGA
jgi:hypothetical protein